MNTHGFPVCVPTYEKRRREDGDFDLDVVLTPEEPSRSRGDDDYDKKVDSPFPYVKKVPSGNKDEGMTDREPER